MTSSTKSLLNCLFTNACLNYSNGVLMHREKLNGNESGEWAKKKNLNSVATSFSQAIISIEKKYTRVIGKAYLNHPRLLFSKIFLCLELEQWAQQSSRGHLEKSLHYCKKFGK